MSLPSRAIPMKINMRPAMSVATRSPPSPYSEAMGARMTTKAAVGPVTWTRDPPRSAATAPPTMAV